ncbi:hypothetical protein P692DRAFT_20757335 [Suillus brevipes Sb2]|nr:hypothetical protein P692DRAFT_20757335 [Suillus brevipes Sb2]
MKEISSIKTMTTAARPNPIGVRPPSKATRNGPLHFPQNVLNVKDDDAMDHSSRDSENNSSPPDTPTPTPRGENSPLPNPRAVSITCSRSSSHSSDDMDDLPEIKLPYLPQPEKSASPHPSPPPPPTSRPPVLPFSPLTLATSDEDSLRAQLEVAETNRSIVRSTAPPSVNTSQRFTPAPEGGFPPIHLAHAAALLDFICTNTINAWLGVASPKFLVRVFDYDGKDHESMNAILTQRIRNAIMEIMTTHNLGPVNPRVAPPSPANGVNAKEFPKAFLVFDIPTEVASMVLHQRIWSSSEITIEARPFLSNALPTAFLCLNGFTTTDPNTVAKAVRDTWLSSETLGKIIEILENSEIPLDRCYDAAIYLCDSITVEFIDYKGAKAISLPRFNIFANCPSNRPKTWTALRVKLMTIHYPTPLDGTGIAIPFTTCSLCHSIGHPNGLCKYPDTPLWNGPKHKSKATKVTPKNRGREKRA